MDLEKEPEVVYVKSASVGTSELVRLPLELLKKMRALWKPRLQEAEGQCLSCPFREGNEVEWRAVVVRLRRAFGIRGRLTSARLERARASGIEDALRRGDFACHSTVYDAQGDMLPIAGRRQCPGASEAYRSGRVR